MRSSAYAQAILVVVALFGAGCGGPGRAQFDHDRCYIDGRPATLPQVEEREAAIQQRLSNRQPWLVVITVTVVALAGAGYLERLLLLFSVSRSSMTMGERFKRIVVRYRAHPFRYFGMVGGSVGLLLTAGILYIYLDADKRASERTLATLQFCHLALRTVDEKAALDAQRSNLASIDQTAAEIRQLINKLPPTEQAKAHEIVGHMDDAVKRQGRFFAEQLQQSQDTAESIRAGTLSIERDLSGLHGDVGQLKEVPARIRTVADALNVVEGKTDEAGKSLVGLRDKIDGLEKAVTALSSRPAPACPACVCAPAVISEAERHVDGGVTASR
jgi:hypothetical protein